MYAQADERMTQILATVDDAHADFYDGTTWLTESGFSNGKLVTAIAEHIPYFEFDSLNRQFRNCISCEELLYVHPTSFLQVEDMFALMNAKDKDFTYQDYADTYRDYWEIYCGDAINEPDFYLCARSWTHLTNVLKSGGAENLWIESKPLGTTDENEIRVVKNMLKALKEKGILHSLYIDSENRVTTLIASRKAKGPFIKAGDLLEIYVYFEACRTNWSDDVQIGYKFRWESEEVINELDCVLTKGYRSILVECKSTKEVDEGYYLTLDSLGDHFGIGCRKVLVVVTRSDSKGYDVQLSRGRQMDILTISQRSDLDRIGEKLKEIMQRGG
jgi:hypothetical protein